MTDRITLRAAGGQYVLTNMAPFAKHELRATSTNPNGEWETFKPIDLGGNRIALQAIDGQYVCAEAGGGREVIANRGAIGDWEAFTVVDAGGGLIALQAHNGMYVCAEGGGGRELVADRTAVGDWEKFERAPKTRYRASCAISIGATGAGGVITSLDFGLGDRLLFDGVIAGLGVAGGGASGELNYSPEELVAFGDVVVEVHIFPIYLQMGWRTHDGRPIGTAQGGGFTLPGGGAGHGSFRFL